MGVSESSTILGFTFDQLPPLLAAVSVATERVVELIKGFVPKLNALLNRSAEPSDDPNAVARRRAFNHLVAMLVGFAILVSAAFQLKIRVDWETLPEFLLLALLASGGSGLWNSLLGVLGAFSRSPTAPPPRPAARGQQEVEEPPITPPRGTPAETP